MKARSSLFPCGRFGDAPVSRREMLRRTGGGFGAMVLAWLLGEEGRLVDQPVAGLLQDLKARGLLESTLVVWGGEFGRTPTVEGDVKKPGRDHNPAGYTIWLAGGGVKGGQSIGATDDVDYTVVDSPVHPNDLQATWLHAFGLDQHALWYEHSGRKEIPTNLGGEIVRKVFS